MSFERKIAAKPIPDYHLLAAAARREQSLAVRGAFVGATNWVVGLFSPTRTTRAAEHLG